jgi:N-acetylglucosamine-6-phosphate deacetylase
MTSATEGLVLAGGRIVLPDRVQDGGWVHVAAGRIVAVGSGSLPADVAVRDLLGGWLLPGYIDLHMHGGGGHDVTSSQAEMAAAVAFHRLHGTTRTLVSLVTAPVDALTEQLGWARQLTDRGPTPKGHVIGSHVEGPFLSHLRCGAQNTDFMVAPSLEVLQALIAAAQGSLRCMTVAPELPGGLDVISALVAAGVVAALGHSDATYAQARTAMAAGATLVTHIFNAMRPLHHREPGLVGAALESGIACELINDGVHTHPAIASLVARDPERLVLVTDAIDAAGVGDGVFSLGGQRVQVHNGRARLTTTSSLAGSTLTMDEAVRRAVVDSGLPIEVASAAASANPARVLGIADRVGSISAGLDADLLILDDGLHPTAVMAAGIWSTVTSQFNINEPLV